MNSSLCLVLQTREQKKETRSSTLLLLCLCRNIHEMLLLVAIHLTRLYTPHVLMRIIPPTCSVFLRAVVSFSLLLIIVPIIPVIPGPGPSLVTPVDLLLQHDAVDAGLEQREDEAGLALELAQPVQYLDGRRAGQRV